MNTGQSAGLTMCFAKVGLTAGTTTTYTTTVATDFVIKGVFGTQFATKTNQATPTTDYVTGSAFTALAVSQGSVYVFCTTSGGTVKVCGGSIEALDSADAFKVYPQLPVLPDDVCPIGYFVIKNGATGSAWTFGSSAWTSTAAVDTTANIAIIPDRPVSA